MEMILIPCLAAKDSNSGNRAIVPSSLMISQMAAAGYSPASRARATEASVCPGRASTSPSAERSGKTCPGRAISSGRVAGAIRARMVVARSKAEMPVVTPCRASTEMVKAVPKQDVFSASGVIIGMRSSSSRSPVIARQISPRPSRAMKLMACGVANSAAMARSPSFSRSSASTMITNLPARKSASASSIPASGIARLSNKLLDILAQNIHFQVHPTVHRLAGQGDVLLCVSYEHECKCVMENVHYGQAHAVYGDETLGGDVAQQLGRGADCHP